MLKRVTLFILTLVISFGFININDASAITPATRIYGIDKYETAVAVSQAGWPNGANTAILVYGENFPDAICATPLAAKYNAPILLTNKKELNTDAHSELIRLKVKQVFIVGGTAVVSENVENKLKQLGISVTRYAGVDMYETSIAVAKAIGTNNGMMITSGKDFMDAISVASIAAQKGMPVILAPTDKLTKPLNNFFKGIKNSKSYVIGDFSQKVLKQFPNPQVITGANRYERNVKILEFFSSDINFSSIYVATGRDFADSLAATSLAQKNRSAVVFVDRDRVPVYTENFLSNRLIHNIYIIGGYGAISKATEDRLVRLPVTIDSIYNINAEIYENEKYDFPKTVTVIRSDGKKEEVPVTWEYSSFKNSSGVYTFEGNIEGTTLKAKLVLTIKPIIKSIETITATVNKDEEFIFPQKVLATLSNGTQMEVPVVWNYNGANLTVPGTYEITGTVKGTTIPAKLKLTVKASSIVELVEIRDEIYGDQKYTFPKTVTAIRSDGTKEELPVTWEYSSIRVTPGIQIFEGKVEGTTLKAKLVLNVKPVIKSIQEIVDIVYKDNVYEFPQKVWVTLSDGSKEYVPVVWNINNANVAVPGTYDITGKVEGTSLAAKLKLIVRTTVVTHVYESTATTYAKANSYTLPEYVRARDSGGSVDQLPVTWDMSKVDLSTPGVVKVTGKVKGTNIPAVLTLTIKPEIVSITDSSTSGLVDGDVYIPSKVWIKLKNNTYEYVPVEWDLSGVDFSKAGVYEVKGKVEGTSIEAKLKIILYD